MTDLRPGATRRVPRAVRIEEGVGERERLWKCLLRVGPQHSFREWLQSFPGQSDPGVRRKR